MEAKICNYTHFILAIYIAGILRIPPAGLVIRGSNLLYSLRVIVENYREGLAGVGGARVMHAAT